MDTTLVRLVQSSSWNLWEVLRIVLGLVALPTLWYTAYQASVRRRAHILEVYRQAFSMLDTPEMRNARSYVYKLPENTHASENWTKLEAIETQNPEQVQLATWRSNRAKAELVCRAFDQLGLLIREGRIPVDILARFYASPALRCWNSVVPYINEVRSPEGRNQPGHLWEWENLIYEIIIPNLRLGDGVWRGVSEHDGLKDRYEVALALRPKFGDRNYRPPMRLWELGHPLAFWKW